MKTIQLLFAGALMLPLFGAPPSIAAEASAPSPAERVPPERANLTVLKVFSAKDGDAIFRAYLVNWKGQDIVVSDSLARSNYQEGETITVLVMNHPFPQGKEGHRLLSFAVVPKAR